MVDISTIETLYSAWTNVSIILLTAALLFYHMTKVKSIHVPIIPAMMVACGLIFIDIIYNLIGLIPYYTRTEKIIHKYSKDEKFYRNTMLFTGATFVLLELMICYWMITDSVSRIKK
jgi:hypothetical protein